VLVWFRITLTTFCARITAIHLYLSKLYLKYYWFHFFPDTVYIYIYMYMFKFNFFLLHSLPLSELILEGLALDLVD